MHNNIHIQKSLNFIAENVFAIITLSVLITLYTYNVNFSTVFFYIFSLIGFIITLGLIIIAFAGFLIKDINDENEKLKSKLQKSEANLIEVYEVLNKEYQRVRNLSELVESKQTVSQEKI